MLKPGLYEQIVNDLLSDSISKADPLSVKTGGLDSGDSHAVLAEYLQHVIGRSLNRFAGQDKLPRQIELCNRIIEQLPDGRAGDIKQAHVSPEAKVLLSVTGDSIGQHPVRPDTPLARGCLLTGTRLDPSLESQIKKEIRTASRIDIICSFVKWSGIRMIEDDLLEFVHRPGASLRVITTSYLGATDLKAIDSLLELPNTEIKVSYDTRRTRLHAKAYTFHRDTGFGTTYIGSANLSRPALTEGLEWNVKISQYESAHLWAKVTGAFETYWNDSEFVTYTQEQRPRLRDALQSEKGNRGTEDFAVNFDLYPYPFQQEILDQIAAERMILRRNRHLVVAATGTGKTMIAAFDYKSWSPAKQGIRPRMLFVAHREEILHQSLQTFRAVLRDQNFGDLWVGEHSADTLDHLFVSIQTYNAKRLWEQLPPEYHDYIVVDEFHRAGARWYDRLLEHVQPQSLLALTATPERTDGVDILRYFSGHMSAEIRLPDAVNRKLLCPFQYFGISDLVDLSTLTWQRGGYLSTELSRLYADNHARARLVIQKTSEILLDARKARGLGFCVSIEHAKYMASKFREAGIPSEALTSNSPAPLRKVVQKQLREREINFIFTVDLYNEGVDIPKVDTVLFLRPTESLTVFLQQLGRGLRHSDGKDCLTVLDFIGQAHRKYRFDVRYRALIDDPSRSVADQVEQDFPHLPAGCSIHLERIAKQHILRNIREGIQSGRSYLVQEIADLAERNSRVPTLGEFLEFYRLDTHDIYREGVSWSMLCRESGVLEEYSENDESRLTKGLRRIQHISGIDQIATLLRLLKSEALIPEDCKLSEAERRQVLMADFSLWGKGFGLSSVAAGLTQLRANPSLCREFTQLLEYKLSRIDAVPPEVLLPFVCPLTLHAQYTRDEILAGLGYWTLDYQKTMYEGVLNVKESKADVFLITLDKTDTDYSPTTMYDDYAISDTLFHWQSQSRTSDHSTTARRYIEHMIEGRTILLFVRERRTMIGLSCPFYFLGPAESATRVANR